jgi:hypothetical protein
MRVDHLARMLAARTGSRRHVARLLAGGGIGGLLAKVCGREAAGRCVLPGRRCQPGERCCEGGRCRRRRCPNVVRTCRLADGRCVASGPVRCAENSSCECFATIEGVAICGEGEGSAGAGCASSADCAANPNLPPDAFCFRCGEETFCGRPCPPANPGPG